MNKFLAIVTIVGIAIIGFSACSNNGKSGAVKEDGLPERSIDDIEMVMMTDSGNHVADPDGFVLPKTIEQTNKRIYKLQTASGVNMAFVVAGKIKTEDMREFALQVGTKYGKAAGNNQKAIVVVMAVENPKWYMAIGNGLKKEFPDTVCQQINNESIAPHLGRGNPDKAVNAVMDAVYERIKPKTNDSDF
ncbi:MAG: TPM domain-containing protein [Prevotellaceae bacterium]|nr:TPM domain-containing protein [Prevotella sp.]MDD7530901.1 TPM domain-containing protein [Prevotellaceae bacterium]MDY2633025.1 TPM domain-containing protein [Prevotella sp.]